MNIYLRDSDISQMPEPGRTWFLNWLPEYLKSKRSGYHEVPIRQQSSEAEALPNQLVFDLESQTSQEKADHSHVRHTQLLDAGITKRGMSVRVKLKRGMAKKRGREYINGLEISAKGTIASNGQEFDKPSPLAERINGSPCNGWEYIEVKKDGRWIRLDELRKIWRETND